MVRDGKRCWRVEKKAVSDFSPFGKDREQKKTSGGAIKRAGPSSRKMEIVGPGGRRILSLEREWRETRALYIQEMIRLRQRKFLFLKK